jgi:hypothetical protein
MGHPAFSPLSCECPEKYRGIHPKDSGEDREKQVLRLRLAQKTRQTSLRMTTLFIQQVVTGYINKLAICCMPVQPDGIGGLIGRYGR